MFTRYAGPLVLIAGAIATGAQSAPATDPKPVSAEASQPTIAGWDAFVEGVRDLPAKMLARLPEAQRNDPQIQQELGRLALSAVAASALEALGGDGDHPAFVASTGQTLTIGQPNADTVYRSAQLTPGGSYRIRGKRGSVRMVRIQESAPRPANGMTKSGANLGPQRVDHDVNALHVDREGRFDVIFSPVRPAGYKGDWWPLQPNTDRLLLRMVSSDWAKEIDPTLSIERIDVPAERPRPSAAELEKRLRAVPKAISFIGPLFVGHMAALRDEGYVNKLKVFDTSQLGGLAGQFYYEGAYDLRDDEALIVEATVPAKCLYRSIILTDDIYETTDWYNNHSSLNDAQAKPDKDGVLRIVVSARDPGVPNWLDTAGYPTGAIQGRWTECDSKPVPSVRKVAFADVRSALPADTPHVTPAQRDAIVRERRSELQQRPLW